jgi:IS4 transposase
MGCLWEDNSEWTAIAGTLSSCQIPALELSNSLAIAAVESGYRSIKRFMAATTSKNFGLRFFYFAFACLLYSVWRAVDLLVQVELTGSYEHSPIVTADNTLTLLKKATRIG